MARKRSAGAIAGDADTAAMDRNTAERNRRVKMKRLCSDLVSLIPTSSTEMVSKTGQLEKAANYIARLKERVRQLEERKARLEMQLSVPASDDSSYPIIEIRDLGSCFEVILISQLCKSFMLSGVVSVLEAEGAEVRGVNVATIGDRVYHTLHAQAKCPRVGVKTSMLGGRLHQLISNIGYM